MTRYRTTPATLDEAKEVIAYLESELRQALSDEDVYAVHKATGLTSGAARLALTLYQSGRVLRPEVLEEMLDRRGGGESVEVVRVYVQQTRSRMGRDAIETVRALGYRLSEPGRDKIRKILENAHQACALYENRPFKV